jgi:hypothetical protein
MRHVRESLRCSQLQRAAEIESPREPHDYDPGRWVRNRM